MAGKIFGNWQIITPIGEGGQGHTYTVKHIDGDDKQYVLKRLKNIKRLDRFKTEVDTMMRLDNPYILKIVDYDLDVKEPYYVSPLYPGGDLTEHLDFWKGDVIATLKIFNRICDGVRAAHLAGIVHRDLKPENILFTADNAHPIVADFGIAYIEDGERQTLTLEAVGPRFYIAPELEDGRTDEITPRSDIYSLGKVLYWMLSDGKRFSREKHNEAAHHIRNYVSIIAESHITPILDRTIVADVTKRYPNIDKLIEDVVRALYSIQGYFNPANMNSEKLCRNCGSSNYVLVINNEPMGIRNFGFSLVGGSDWRIYVCPSCSYVALFRPDYKRR